MDELDDLVDGFGALERVVGTDGFTRAIELPRQRPVHVAAMKQVVRRAVAGFGFAGEPRAAKRAAVLPAPLMRARRLHADARHLVMRFRGIEPAHDRLAVDQLAIDGAVNGSATLARGVAQRFRRAADGSIKSYALWMGAGAACLALVWILGGRA